MGPGELDFRPGVKRSNDDHVLSEKIRQIIQGPCYNVKMCESERKVNKIRDGKARKRH